MTATNNPIFEAYCRACCEVWAGTNRHSTARRAAKRVVTWLVEERGLERWDEVSTAELEHYIAERLEAGIQAATVAHEMSAFSNVVKAAQASPSLLTSTPPRIPSIRPDAKRNRHLSLAEQDAMLAFFNRYEPEIGRLCIVAIACGLRISEALAMEWGQVSIDHGTLLIPKGKTATSAATIPLSKKARAALLDQKQITKPDSLKERVWNLTRARVYEFWGDMRRIALGLTDDDHDVTFHVLRHTTANRMLEKGVDIVTVSKFMRHADINTTMRYITDNASHLREASEIADI